MCTELSCMPSIHCTHSFISLTKGLMESLYASILTARETNTVEGSNMPMKLATAKRITILINANFIARILFPLECFKSHKVHNYCPDPQYADLAPATRKARAFECNVAHGVVEMRK